jgi:hypothetical protein
MRCTLRALFFGLLMAKLGADVAVPARVLSPETAAEAWDVIRLVIANTERLISENRLAEIPNQIALCNPALRRLASEARPGDDAPTRALVVRANVAVTVLAQAGLAGDADSVRTSFANLLATIHELETHFDPKDVSARIFLCPMHPECLSPDPAAVCEKCGMNLVARRIPYSFLYLKPGEPTIRLTARAAGPLQRGRSAEIRVSLQDAAGVPVETNDLAVMHTQPIHLLIVDRSLSDYHHEHPMPTGKPGEYLFRFIPQRDGPYRVFADLVPLATGVQEYAFNDLPGARDVNAKAGGLTFRAEWGGNNAPLRVGAVRNLTITVTDREGRPTRNLAPLMNAFAHVVGFYEDGRTVVHIHPEGGEILRDDVRGGPTMTFRVYPPKSGNVRLYCQVLVEGKQIFAPFDVRVEAE